MSKRNGEVTSEVRRVRVSDLRIHPTAQRRLVPATLKKIAADLDLDGIGTIHAVEYEIDGVRALWVIDGQHRITILRESGYGDLVVDVKVHASVKDDAGASRLFRILNTRAGIAAYDEYVNALHEGLPDALGVDRITRSHGIRVERHQSDGTISCVKTLKNLYRRDDGDSLDKTLATAIAAWGRTSAAVEGKVIEGLGQVFSTYNGKVNRPVLVKKLAKYPGGAAGLLGNAKALRAIRTASLGRCVASIIVETYNKGRRSDVLESL